MKKLIVLAVLLTIPRLSMADEGVCSPGSTIQQALASCIATFIPGVSGEITSYSINQYYNCPMPIADPPIGYGLIPGTQLASIIANCVAVLPAVVLGAIIDHQYNSIQVAYGGINPGICPEGMIAMTMIYGVACIPDPAPVIPPCATVSDPKPNAIAINDTSTGYDCGRKAPNPTQVEVLMEVTCKDAQGNNSTKLSSGLMWCSAGGPR